MTAINSNRAIRGPVTAVPVVAGKGVRLTADTENNRWVVEADETVLWEGTCLTQGSASVNLSEAASNFEKIAVYAVPNPSSSFNDKPQIFTYAGNCTMGAYICPFMTSSQKGKFAYGRWVISNGTSFDLVDAGQTDSYPTIGFNNTYGGIIKIVGINRISASN